MWSLGLLLAACLWPLSPPDQSSLGDAGWAAAIGMEVAGISYVYTLASSRFEWTFGMLLLSGYAGVLMIAVTQWLAGGVGAPYERLMLIAVLYVSALHPLRRIIPFMGFVAVALALPFIYDHWDMRVAASSIAGFVVWCALALVAHLLMRNVRAQRISMRADENAAREEARLDELTQIGNRRAFEEALEDEVARVRRLGTPLSVSMLDIEQFKSVNDEFGHLEGDRALRAIADAIGSELRAPDRVYRWGGDEFALILPGTRGIGAERLGERLRNFVSVRCKRPDGAALMVRCGSAQLESGMSAGELVARADLELGARLSR